MKKITVHNYRTSIKKNKINLKFPKSNYTSNIKNWLEIKKCYYTFQIKMRLIQNVSILIYNINLNIEILTSELDLFAIESKVKQNMQTYILPMMEQISKE